MAGPKPDRSKGRHPSQALIGRGAAGGEYIRNVADINTADDVVAQAAAVLAAGGPIVATDAPPPIFSPAALPGDVVLAPDDVRHGDRLAPPVWPGGRRDAPNPDDTFRVVGHRNRKVEGVSKVTGRAVYTDDIVLPRMLHAKLLRSIHAHARIVSIDASAALAMPGVHAVITGKDLPGYFGIIPWTQDEQPLCETKARYVGDAIAAIAADSEYIAEEALHAIVVEYEVLPAVMSIDDAIEHPEWVVNEKAKRGNVSKHALLEFGDVDAALAASDAVVESE